MSDKLPDRILRHISHEKYEPQKTGALARSMGIEDEEYHEFRRAVKDLMAAGRIVQGSKNAVTLPRAGREVIGTFRGHARGFGFVVPQSPADHGDLYIPEGESIDAITGDTVLAHVLKRGKRRGDPNGEPHPGRSAVQSQEHQVILPDLDERSRAPEARGFETGEREATPCRITSLHAFSAQQISHSQLNLPGSPDEDYRPG